MNVVNLNMVSVLSLTLYFWFSHFSFGCFDLYLLCSWLVTVSYSNFCSYLSYFQVRSSFLSCSVTVVIVSCYSPEFLFFLLSRYHVKSPLLYEKAPVQWLLLSLCILYSFAYHLIFPDFVQVCPWWFPSPWLHVYLRPQFSLMSCCIVLFVSSGVSPACFCLLCSSLSLSLCTLFCMDYFPFIQICLGVFILATILL